MSLALGGPLPPRALALAPVAEPPKALVDLMRRLLRHVAQEILKRHQAGGAAEDVVADLGFDVDHQFLENLERLGLVFDQRIALAVRAQADAVAQAVHLVKMLLPELVNGAQNRVALDRP